VSELCPASRRVDDGELAIVKERSKRCERWVQTKNPSSPPPPGPAIARSGDRDRGPHTIVVRLAERHDDVQAVRGAALKQHDKLLLAETRVRGRDGRCKNVGSVLIPSMAIPPPLMKIRREICMAFFLSTAHSRASDLCKSCRALPSLKLRCAKHQTRYRANINLLQLIVQACLQDLRVNELLL